MIASSQAGTSGWSARIDLGVSSQTRRRTASAVSARNGGCPVHMAYMTPPRPKRSTRGSMGSHRACSGAM